MTAIKSFLYPFLFLSILFLHSSCETSFQEKSPTKRSVSGAYEALSMLGEARSYPNKKMPDDAFYTAWEATQEMIKLEKNNSTIEPWESMGPHNRGGRTLALALNPQNTNTIYAGSASGGLWRSYSGGAGEDAWERVSIDYPVLGVSSITFAPNDSMTMYIGTGEVYNYSEAGTGAAYRRARGTYGIGILKSTDGGVTWEKSLDWSYAQNRGIWSIEVNPQVPTIVIAGTTDGVYRSTDAGNSWSKVLNVPMVMDILINPINSAEILAACGNFGTNAKGIYKSNNGGVDWTNIQDTSIPTSFLGKIQMAYAPSQPNIVYASIGNGFGFNDGATWLLRSEDFGSTWTLQNQTDYSRWQGWFAHDVDVSPTNPNVIICIGIEVWKSIDAGITLEQVSIGGTGSDDPPIGGPDGADNYVHSDAHDVIYHPTNPNRLYIASDGGIVESSDGGITFDGRNGRYQTVQFYNGFSNSYQDSTLALGGLQDNNTILWGGEKRWRTEVGGDGSWTGIDISDDNIIYGSSQYLNIRKSLNGGNSFSFDIAPPAGGENVAFIAPFVVAQNNTSILYAGGTRIYKSYNKGDSWEFTNNGISLDGSNPAFCMEVAPSNDNVVYVGTAPDLTRSNIFVTQNGGDTWTNITQNLPDRYPNDVTVDPVDPATAYVTFSGFGTGHVFKTQDYGANWEDITGDLPDVPTNAVVVDPLNSAHVYVGNDIGVFVSEDGGNTWEAFQDGLPTVILVFDLKVSPTNRKLRVATHGNGAYQRDLLDQSVSTNTVLNPDWAKIKLFPNPAIDYINVSITNVENNPQKLSVIDLKGRLLEERILDASEQQIQIHTANWAGGTYWCQFEGAGQLWTIPFVVSQ